MLYLFIFLCSCLIQVVGYSGIYYSSPTLGTAMLNLVPAFTFILAVTLRLCFFLNTVTFVTFFMVGDWLFLLLVESFWLIYYTKIDANELNLS